MLGEAVATLRAQQEQFQWTLVPSGANVVREQQTDIPRVEVSR